MNPFGRPSARSLKLLKVNGVRMVAFNEPMWYTYYRELETAGLEIAVVYTGQSFTSHEGVADQCRRYANQINPAMHILGNEWNKVLDASWPAGGEEAFILFWNGAAPAIKAARPDAQLYVGGLYSDDTAISRLQRIWPRLEPKPQGIDYHPYEEGYEEAGELLVAIKQALSNEHEVKVSAMEWNDSDPAGVKRFQKILERSIDHSAFFCYSDLMVDGHGVIDALGRRKPTWYALRDAYARQG